jgi:hypothetical protein
MKAAEAKIISPSKDKLPESLFSGVKAIFLRNNRKRFFIPSTKNFFGKLQTKIAMHDSGCGSHLLSPTSEADLFNILNEYKPSAFLLHTYSFRECKGVAGKFIVMNIKQEEKLFKVKLCNDILGDEITAEINSLVIYLCSDDVATLLNFNGNNKLSDKQKIALRKLQDLHISHRTERRTHSFIGQDILDNLTSFVVGGFSILVRRESFDTANLYEKMELMCQELESSPSTLPEDFDYLESEDFLDDSGNFELCIG